MGSWWSAISWNTHSRSIIRTDIPAGNYPWIIFAMSCTLVVGVPINAMVIYVHLTNKKLRSQSTFMTLLGVPISDLMIGMIGNTMVLVNAIHGYWAFGELACVGYALLMSIFGIGSICTLAALSYGRYQLICNLGRGNIIGGNKTVFGVWCYVVFLSILPLIGWGAYRSEANNLSCSMNWEDDSINARSYLLFLFVAAFFIPVGIMIRSYTVIYFTLKNNAFYGTKEKRACKLIFAGAMAFLIAWTPYAVFSFVTMIGLYKFPPNLALIPCMIAKLSPCINPLAHFIYNQQFREALMEKWRKIRGLEPPEEMIELPKTSLFSRFSRGISSARTSENKSENVISFPRKADEASTNFHKDENSGNSKIIGKDQNTKGNDQNNNDERSRKSSKNGDVSPSNSKHSGEETIFFIDCKRERSVQNAGVKERQNEEINSKPVLLVTKINSGSDLKVTEIKEQQKL